MALLGGKGTATCILGHGNNINVFMATDGEDGNRYQLEKVMLTLSSCSLLS